MKRSLMRPTAALFPAVLLAAGLYSPGTLPEQLFFYWGMIQICSLCSVDAFRNAAAREPGVRRVDRRFSGSWFMILLGVVLTGFVNNVRMDRLNFPILLIAAGFIIIEQLFEERMYALSRESDGVILSVISNVLLLAGIMLDVSGGVAAPIDVSGFYSACGAGLGAAISIAASYAVEPMHAFSLVPRNIAFFQKAAVQCLLYPAAVFVFVIFLGVEYAMAGMILWRLSRTVCRRAHDESRPLNLLLVGACAVLAAASIWLPVLQMYALAAILAMLCAVAVFCAPGWRIYCGAALLIAANVQLRCGIIPEAYGIYAVVVLSAAAVILNLHKAFLRKV